MISSCVLCLISYFIVLITRCAFGHVSPAPSHSVGTKRQINIRSLGQFRFGSLSNQRTLRSPSKGETFAYRDSIKLF